MPRIRVLFNVMIDPMPLKCTFQACRRAPQRPVATAEARYHWTSAIEDRIDVVRDLAIIWGYCRIAMAGCEQDCKTTCRAEPNDTSLVGTIRAVFQPLPDSVNIIERSSPAR